MDDAGVARRAREGDPRAFEELVVRHQRRVWRLALRLVGSPADADDAAQEAFLTVYRTLDRYDPALPFGPWLVTLTTRVCLNWLRTRRRRPAEPLEEAEDPSPGPHGEAERRELRRAVQGLDDIPRAVVALHYGEGMTCAEIGEALGMSAGAVKVALFRARTKLRRALAEDDDAL